MESFRRIDKGHEAIVAEDGSNSVREGETNHFKNETVTEGQFAVPEFPVVLLQLGEYTQEICHAITGIRDLKTGDCTSLSMIRVRAGSPESLIATLVARCCNNPNGPILGERLQPISEVWVNNND
jgi:hypothetical protein